MSFNSLGLSAEILRAVSTQGYSVPTLIQQQSIPIALVGRDILAGAQTGTGKTAGFALPILQRLSKINPANGHNKGHRPIRALILAPTRELAAQIEQSVRTYGKYLSLRSTAVFGGVNINPQIRKLRNGVDILIATPGRLLDHVQQKTLNLSSIETLVLDEADRMLDMGFIRDIRRIISLLPKQRQNLMFSATFSNDIKKLAGNILKSPEIIQIDRYNTTAESVTHTIHPVDHSRKSELLIHLIESRNWQQVLVFIGMKHSANRLARQLDKAGIRAAAIHGDKSQAQRTKALADFKKLKVQVLVGTDVASRGLDIDQLPHVVNYELPINPEDYIHRIGRTGRAGHTGEAVSLVAASEQRLLKDIEKLLKQHLPKVVVPGYEPDPRITVLPGQEIGSNRALTHNGTGKRHNGGGYRSKKNSQGGGHRSRRNTSRRTNPSL